MKIGFVLDDTLDKPDGVQQYILVLGQWLKRNGHQVHYLVADSKQDDTGRVHGLAKLVNLSFNGNNVRTPLPTSNAAIRRVLEREQFDVLHIQLPYSPFFGGRVAKLASTKTALIGTFHILPYSLFSRLAARSLRLTSRQLTNFDTLLSVSSPAQKFAKQSLGISSQIVPNAVDIARFKTGKNRKPGTKIVFLGRLVERKGCLYLLQAVKQLGDMNFSLDIGGTGPLKSKLESYVASNNLQDKVTFKGFIEENDKADFLASADIAVFPSTSGESFGIVLLEAMANGKSVVLAGNNPGYASVITNQDQLFDPKKSYQLAKQLRKYLTDKKAIRSALAWQRSHLKQYDINQVGQQIEQVYTNALQTKT